MPLVHPDELKGTTVDYLVIGGGTSGLVVAARLSEDPNVAVLVVEAGLDHAGDTSVDIPGFMGKTIRNPEYDWAFVSEPQKYAFDRNISHPRGKGLGGSSLLNSLAFVRPVKEELDAFEKLGNPGWNWESMLQYMKKGEHLCRPALSQEEKKLFANDPDPESHGIDGPIAMSFPPYISPVLGRLLDSLGKSGIPRNCEPNSGRNVGAFLSSTSVDPVTATRSYSASAYLQPNLTRKNLLVITEGFVRKIHFEETEGCLQRAKSVDFVKDGSTYTIHVVKEVILSAGTFQSPQLLEASGIGDRRVLEPLGIHCILDLAGVGENLQDHVKASIVARVKEDLPTAEILRGSEELKIQLELYKQQQGILSGMLSSCFAFMPGNSFASPEKLESWKRLANVEATRELFQNTHADVVKGIQKQYEILKTYIDDPIHPLSQLMHITGHFGVIGHTADTSQRYMAFIPTCAHPFSRGSVHIKSQDIHVPPTIQPNYLSNRADMEVLTKAVEFILRVCSDGLLEDMIVELIPSPDSDEEKLEKFCREVVTTVHHPVGTVSMLPREDGGVVDPNLLVYGTSNLRVVDCSVVPLLVSCNTVSLAYAIGEKAADIIKAANV